MSTPPIDGPQRTPADEHRQPGYQQGGKRRGRPPLWVGLGLLGLGAVAFVIGLIVMLSSIVGGVAQVAEARPAAEQRLEAGTEYSIFTDSMQDAGPCTVFDPDFDIIDVESPAGRRTVTSEDRTFLQLGSFTATDAGSYQVSCDGVHGGELYVTDVHVGGILRDALGGVIALLLGGLLVVVGIILVIVNRVTARRR